MKKLLVCLLPLVSSRCADLPHGTIIKLITMENREKKTMDIYAVKTNDLCFYFHSIMTKIQQMNNVKFVVTLQSESTDPWDTKKKPEYTIVKKTNTPTLECFRDAKSKKEYKKLCELPQLVDSDPRLQLIKIFMPSDKDHAPMFRTILDVLEKDKLNII